MQFLNLISTPQLRKDQSRDCEFIVFEKDLLLRWKSGSNNKLPGNNSIKSPLLSSFKSAFNKGKLSNSKSQR